MRLAPVSLRQLFCWGTFALLMTSCELFRDVSKSRSASRPASRTAAKKSPARPTTAPQTFKAVRYSDEVVSDLINSARSYGGTNYRMGGGTSVGLDCSALVQVSFRQIGMKLPRTAAEQAALGEEVSVRKARPGDLVVFSTNYRGGGYINHIGIITQVESDEHIRFIHSSSSRGVREDDLATEYWQKAFVKITRVF